MAECRPWRARKHSGSGIPHNFAHLLAVVRLIAVHRAFGTDRLLGQKMAVFQPLVRISLQLSAILTQPLFLPMLVVAIQKKHEGDCLFLGVQNLRFFHEATILAHL